MHLLLKFSWQTGTLNGKNQERVILNPRVRSVKGWSPWSRQRLEVKGPLDQEVIIKKENTISTSSSKTKGHFSSVQALSCVQLFATPWSAAHQRPPCPSPAPGVYPNSCPLSQWCHPPSHSLLSASPLAFNLSQHQDLFKWVSSSHQVVKVLEFQLQHQSFQWTIRTDLL